MRLDDNLFEEIISRNNIVDVIGERISLTKKGANYMGLCPFHGEKTASFSVSPSRQIFKCFGCGKGGNVITFIKEYDNMTGGEAVRYLAQRAGIELPEGNYTSEEKKANAEREQLYEINKQAAIYFHALLKSPHGEQGLAYFRKRGLSDETINHFGLGYSDKFADDLYKYLKSKGFSDEILAKSGLVSYDEKNGWHDKFWNRVMYPIMDPNNRVIAFGGRVMGEGEPKYLNSPETKLFNKSQVMYGMNFAKKSHEHYFLICEGYMDVIALQTAGFTNSVAALGTAFTGLNARTISHYTKEVVLTFDSDGAGIKAALRAIPILKAEGVSCKVLTMKPHKDPDEFIKALGADAYRERILSAKPSFNFEIEQMETKYNLQNPDEKTAFYMELADYLSNIKETVARNNYIEAVDNIYHMGIENMRKLVAEKGEKKHSQEIAAETVENERQEYRRTKNADSASLQAQKMLLTWAIGDAEVRAALKRYLTADAFEDETAAKVAEIVFAMEGNGGLSPGTILNRFDDEDEQAAVAGIFSCNLREDMTDAEKETTFSDTVRRLLEEKLDKQINLAADSGDFEAFEKLQKERINLPKKSITLKAGK